MADDDNDSPRESQLENYVPLKVEIVAGDLLAPPKYEIRPSLEDRFQAGMITEIMDQTMRETLTGRTYSGTQAEKWVRTIANTVRERVNLLDMKRYKVIVQVMLGEMRGAGIKSGMRCLWDSECDNYATHNFFSEVIFCNTTVYGVYFY